MTTLKDVWNTVFPDKGQGVRESYREYTKKSLDLGLNPSYDEVQVEVPVEKPKMEAVKVTTVEDIVNATGDKYPAYVNELAKILRDTKIAYSLHASEYAAKLFAAQDSLGLSTDEMTKAIAAIISQKDVINSSVQKAIDIINKPKV